MVQKIREYIKTWQDRCYPDGLPDEVPIEISDMVPSYKRICIAILKNDYPLKSLGLSPPKSEVYSLLKKCELRMKNINTRLALTEQEIRVMQMLQRHPFGYIRGYNGNARLQDENFSPIANISKKQIESLVQKNYLQLLPDHKFKTL